MKISEQLITPEWAQSKLDQLQKSIDAGTFKQRPPRIRAIQRYASDMVAGKWLLTHQGIAFDEDDNLLDGQNRLWAVVRAAKPVKMLVTTGLPKNGKLTAMDVIDGGMVRSLANHLQLSHGYGTEAHEASALVRSICNLVMASSFGGVNKARFNFQISAAEAIYILDDLGFKGALDRFRIIASLKKLRQRALLGPWCWYHAVEGDSAELFLTEYVNLEGLKSKSPVLLLTRFFQTLTKKGRKNEIALIRTTANAIFAHANDKKLEELRASHEALEWLVGLNKKVAKMIAHRINPKSEL